MPRNNPRTLIGAFVASFALVVAACGSDTTSPLPSAVSVTAAPASVAPTPVESGIPNPTPAASPSQAVIGAGSWTATGSMIRGRSHGAAATVLQDGKVLVAGGEAEDTFATAATELYDPATGSWTRTGKLHSRRRGDSATLLADGQVLVIGGFGSPPRVGELYDPGTGTWSLTRQMARWRYSPSVAALADGRVLVFGGWAESGTWSHRADLYDPTTGRWDATGHMAAPQGPFTVLGDGRVLVMHEGHAPEVFDPITGRWRSVARPTTDVPWNALVLLADGRALALSTRDGESELYDPTADRWIATSTSHTGEGPATLLDDGTVLVVGKVRSSRFDPTTGSWSDVPRPPLPRDYALDSIDGVEVNMIARLPDGKVLATEGGSAAVYDPTSAR
jgi:hypothetical protein